MSREDVKLRALEHVDFIKSKYRDEIDKCIANTRVYNNNYRYTGLTQAPQAQTPQSLNLAHDTVDKS